MTLPPLLRVYATTFKTELAVMLMYRAALGIWAMALSVQPVVSLVVWTAVAESRGGAAGGITRGEFAAYFTTLLIVNQLTFTWQYGQFEERIRQGYFSPLLLRPVHPIHADVAQNLTFKGLTLTVLVPVAVLLALLFDATFQTTVWDVVAFVPALLLAMALRFCLEWTLGTVAFWLTRTGAVVQTYQVAMFFLSGQVAPLVLFPPLVRLIATLLPFRWMVAFPVALLLGRLSPAEVAAGLAAQLAWMAVSLILLRLCWAAGIKRYSAVGA